MTFTDEALLENLKAVFIDQENYYFDKYVPEFTHQDKFLGDCFNMIMVEPKTPKPPRFYHTFSPFDVISNKAPYRALAYENGELLLDIDFAKYVAMRTGAMDAFLLRAIGVSSLADKKVLYVGSGKISQSSLRVLKGQFPELTKVDCINRSGDLEDLQKVVKESSVEVKRGDLKNISNYDLIFCHTNAKEPLLAKDLLGNIKKGAIITTTISSTEHGEVADEFYSSKDANIICDWPRTVVEAKDLGRAINMDIANKDEIIFLKDLLGGTRSVSETKKYTIYRSLGTPLQNLAVLQLLAGQN